MNFLKYAAILPALAFSFSINGYVVSETGEGIPGVYISSFNYPGVEGISDYSGFFEIGNDATAIRHIQTNPLQIKWQNQTLHIAGDGSSFKLSLMDAMGKVIFQKEVYTTNVEFDLSKIGHNAMFVKITGLNFTKDYVISKNGALKKESDALAKLMFVKEGYVSTGYSMVKDVEENVTIVMALASSSSSNTPESSSSVKNPNVESSSSSFYITVPDAIIPSTKLTPGKYNRTVDGRAYILYVPSTYTGTSAAPLIVDYHPIGSTASAWSNSATYESETQADGAIIIYPDGGEYPSGGMMSGGHAWNVGPCCSTDDDVTFSRHVIEDAKTVVYIDPTRIYATGFSMGGGMSNYVACFMADVYAAVVPASFDLAKEIVDAGACNPVRPMPILNFRGTGDYIVSYNGGLSEAVPGRSITFMGAENNLLEWAQMNGCMGTPTEGIPESGCKTYEQCSNGVKVGLCTNKLGSSCSGSGHEAVCVRTAWNFLKQFKLK